MYLTTLETVQIFLNHPIIGEDNDYKIKYLNVLEYFLEKYSKDDLWSQQTFKLYTKYLLSGEYQFKYSNVSFHNNLNSSFYLPIKFVTFNYCIERNIHGSLQSAINWRSSVFSKIKFFPYIYCLLMDCIFICAFRDRKKGEKIYFELSSMYNEKYRNNLRNMFGFLYDGSIAIQ